MIAPDPQWRTSRTKAPVLLQLTHPLQPGSAPGAHRRPLTPLWLVLLFYAAIGAVALVWQAYRAPGLMGLVRVPIEHTVPWWAAAVGTSWLLVLGPALLEDKLPALRAVSVELYESVAPITTRRVAVFAGMSGFCEELLFRGPLQETVGWVAAAVLFALLHGGFSKKHWPWTLFALTAGLLLGLMVEVYGALSPAMVAHITVNAINMRRLERYAPLARRMGP